MITAKFPGRCPGCGRTIRPGELIDKPDDLDDDAPWMHADCADRYAYTRHWAHQNHHQSAQPHVAAEWPDAMFDDIPTALAPKVYKSLAQVLHPDVGGDTKTMQKINAAYDRHRVGGRP